MSQVFTTNDLRPPELVKAQLGIGACVQWQNNNGYRKDWETYIEMYEHGRIRQSVSGFEDENCHDPSINLIWSTINTAYSSINPSHAQFTVNAVNPDDALNAIILQHVMNGDWKNGEMGKPVTEAVKDSLIIGHGIVRVDYSSLNVRKSKNFDPTNPDHAKGMVAEMNSEARKGFGFTNTIDSNKTSYSLYDKNFQIAVLNEGARVKRVSPFDFFVDHYATRWEDCRWVAQRYYVPIEEARNNKSWKKSSRDNLHTSVGATISFDNTNTLIRNSAFGFGDSELIEIIEFYNLLTGKFSVFSMLGDDFLLDPAPTPGFFGHPFVVLDNERITDKLYPVGEVANIKSLQLELNESRKERLVRRESFKPRWLAKKDAFDAEGMENLTSDSPHPLLVNVVSEDPLSSVIMPLAPGHIPDTTYVDDHNIRNDIYEVSGLSDFQRGVSANVNTATEASLISSGDKSRVSRKILNVESFITTIGQKMAVLTQQYTSVPRALRVTGIAGLSSDALGNSGQIIGDTLYFSAGRNSLSGPMDIDLAVGSVSPRNGETKQKEASQILALMMPFTQLGIVDPKALISYVLKMGFDIQSPETFFVPPAPPAQTAPDASGATQGALGSNVPPNSSAQAVGPSGPQVQPGSAPAVGAGDIATRNQLL